MSRIRSRRKRYPNYADTLCATAKVCKDLGRQRGIIRMSAWCSLQLAAPEQDRPELHDMLTLRDRVGCDETDPGAGALPVNPRPSESRADVIERATVLSERRDPAHLRALLRRLAFRAHERRIA